MADDTPPILLAPAVARAITDEGARIELETNEDAAVLVEYQAIDTNGKPLRLQRAKRTTKHSIPLTNLLAETEYA